MTFKAGIMIGGLAALAAGCAALDEKQPTTEYWNKTSGIAVVHKIKGKVETTTETLSDKPLTDAEIDAHGLKKGQKYFQVVEVKPAPPKPAKTPDKAKNDADNSKDKLAGVTRQLSDLKSQISAVAADNKRLQKQLDTASKQSPTPVPQVDPNPMITPGQ